MRNIAAKTGRAIAAPALLYALAVGTAYAKSPLDQSQRPGETPEIAQPRSCMPHEGADDKLRSEYGEKVLGHGVSSDGTLIEIFLAPSGTFTVIKTTQRASAAWWISAKAGRHCISEQVGFTPEALKFGARIDSPLGTFLHSSSATEPSWRDAER